jgi:hypothetical protein
MPPAIAFISANQGAERFSFYGVGAILVVFMTQCPLDASGMPDPMREERAKGCQHLCVLAVYFTPLMGALVSEGALRRPAGQLNAGASKMTCVVPSPKHALPSRNKLARYDFLSWYRTLPSGIRKF